MINEALAYFGDDNGFLRLFSLFKKKYESLGRIGGTVNVSHFTNIELEAPARFFGITARDLKQKDKIALESFEKQLQSTRFGSIGLKELLEAYFNEPLVSKKEMKQLKDRQQSLVLDQLESDFPKLTNWINYLRKKTPDTYWIYRLLEESGDTFMRCVQQLESAFSQLPDSFERLPMFSQRITKNPHAFDLNTNTGRMLIHLLAVDYYEHDDSIVLPTDSKSINDLLLTYRILRDDITNYVTCVNLLAETNDGPHQMWEAAAATHSVMNMPLRELIALTSVYPANKKETVWIVENSGVYSSILDQLPNVPLICTHGQFKLAALLLLDLLAKGGCTLYYAGDLDPEGMGMAERLLRRHPKNVKLWKMDRISYEKSAADILMSNERLKKIDSVTVPQLLPVVNELRKRKKAGYQEALVGEMVSELAGNLN